MKKRADGRWVKKITLPNGKTKYFYSSANTQRDATKDFNKQIMEFEEKDKKGKTFIEVAELWNEEYRERTTNIAYNKGPRSQYNKITDFFSNNEDIEKISPMDINNFFNSLIVKGYYKKTISNHKSVLNMIFSYAVLKGYIKHNPVSDVRLPANLPKAKRKLPQTAEIKEVEKHFKGFDLLPYFLLFSGLRISEALALDYKDIDFEKKTITVNKHLIYDSNQPLIENKTKTANSERTVVLLDRLAEKLPKKKSGLVFCDTDGKSYTKTKMARRWEKYQKEYNLTLTAHQLRHAYATMLFEAGIDVKDAQELMGHSDINLTRQIYTHIRNERKEETAKKLNDFTF